jgi:prepilin-type N-terminal cleavage/methylation domain-containing protein
MEKFKVQTATIPPSGYTLVELMITVAIISILAAVSIPKFANLSGKAREGTVKGTLSALRSVIAIYYADNTGVFPTDGIDLVPKYMDPLPPIIIPPPGNHPLASDFTYVEDDWATGAWLYASETGRVAVNCTHTDAKGGVWSRY